MRILMLCLTMLLVACSNTSTNTAVNTIAQAKLADVLIQSGVVDDAVLSADLTDTELQTYIDALDVYQAFRDQWKHPSVDMYLLLESQYGDLFAAYKAVESVVMSNWDEYPPPVKAELQRYQLQARMIHEGVMLAFEAKDKQAALNQALELGIIIAKVAAM